MRSLAVLLVVLVLLAIGADRIAVRVAASRIADGIQQTQELDRKPSVSIDGFPFLTQVIAGHFDGVHITARGLTGANSGGSVRIAELSAKATDLTTSKGFSRVTAGKATGTVLMTYHDLSQAVGATLSYGGTAANGHGRIRASGSVTVLGQKLTGSVGAEVVVAGINKLGFGSVQVEGVNIPQPLTAALAAIFSHQLSLSQIPAGLTIRSIDADPDGVTATVAGSNVTFQK